MDPFARTPLVGQVVEEGQLYGGEHPCLCAEFASGVSQIMFGDKKNQGSKKKPPARARPSGTPRVAIRPPPAPPPT